MTCRKIYPYRYILVVTALAMALARCVYGVNETEDLLITPGDHVAVFTTPVEGDGITRRLELKVVLNSRATANIPGASGWGHESNVNTKYIDIDRCDKNEEGRHLDDNGNPITDSEGNVLPGVTNPEEIYAIAYHGTASTAEGYNFVTNIENGRIVYCEGAGGSGGEGEDPAYTIRIKDEGKIHIKSNPAFVKVSTAEEDYWVKLEAFRYRNGDPEDIEHPVPVKWAHVDKVQFSRSEDGAVMDESALRNYEDSFIWAKASVAGSYTIRVTSDGSSDKVSVASSASSESE